MRTARAVPTPYLERQLSMAERAAEQARSDLSAEQSRKGLKTEDEKADRYYRQAVLDERERILAILTNPIAARQPRLADTFAFQSDIPAAEAVAAMEAQAPHADATQRSAKEMAAKIVHMGKVRRGVVAAPVTGAGPKNFVTATPEAISAAAKKARGEA